MKNLFCIFILVHFSIISFSQINADSSNLYLGPDFNLCKGYIHLLDAGPGFDAYLWQDGSSDQTFLVSEAGTYWVHAYLGAIMYADTITLGLLALP